MILVGITVALIIMAGPIVRVSPNELSFGSAGSWKEIYGFPSQNQNPMLKSNFYRLLRSGFESGCIGCEQDPTIARRMKANLSAAFSSKALLEQEKIMQNTIDFLINRLESETQSGKDADMAKWMELVAFDLMGEMTFGESFGCLEHSISSLLLNKSGVKPYGTIGERHEWIKLILDHTFFVTLADNLRRITIAAILGTLMAPMIDFAKRKHIEFTRNKVKR